MSDVTVFHNQACSKSRGALAILDERGVEYDVVRYLDTPPDRATIERDQPIRIDVLVRALGRGLELQPGVLDDRLDRARG